MGAAAINDALIDGGEFQSLFLWMTLVGPLPSTAPMIGASVFQSLFLWMTLVGLGDLAERVALVVGVSILVLVDDARGQRGATSGSHAQNRVSILVLVDDARGHDPYECQIAGCECLNPCSCG